MPLLRKVAVDVCDAKDGDFDLPDVRPIQTPFFFFKITIAAATAVYC